VSYSFISTSATVYSAEFCDGHEHIVYMYSMCIVLLAFYTAVAATALSTNANSVTVSVTYVYQLSLAATVALLSSSLCSSVQ
jgi:hypothetical protein